MNLKKKILAFFIVALISYSFADTSTFTVFDKVKPLKMAEEKFIQIEIDKKIAYTEPRLLKTDFLIASDKILYGSSAGIVDIIISLQTKQAGNYKIGFKTKSKGVMFEDKATGERLEATDREAIFSNTFYLQDKLLEKHYIAIFKPQEIATAEEFFIIIYDKFNNPIQELDPFLSGFSARFAWYLDTTQLANPVTADHAFLIHIPNSLTEFWLKHLYTTTNGITFTKADGTTEYNWYLEDYDINATDKNIWAWLAGTDTYPNSYDLNGYVYVGGADIAYNDAGNLVFPADYNLMALFNSSSGTILTDATTHKNGSIDDGGWTSNINVDGAFNFAGSRDANVNTGAPHNTNYTIVAMVMPTLAAQDDLAAFDDVRLYRRITGDCPYAWNYTNAIGTKLCGHMFALNQWQQVAVRYTEATGTRTISYNGIDENSAVSDLTITSNTLYISRYAGSVTSFFNGYIDTLIYFNRALSADEIKLLWLSSSGLNVTFGTMETQDINFTYEFKNYVTFDINKFTENLKYDLNYRCSPTDGNTVIILQENDINKQNNQLTCNDTNQFITAQSYLSATEGAKNIKLRIFSDNVSKNALLAESYFSFDYNAPTIAIFDINGFGDVFNGDANALVTLNCSDIVSPNLRYTITVNDYNYYDTNRAKDTNVNQQIVLITGGTDITVTCKDLLGRTASDNNFLEIYFYTFRLIDEKTAQDFNLDYVNDAVIYSLDSNYSFNFKTNSIIYVNYSFPESDTLRLDLNYDGCTKVQRQFNTELLGSDTNVRLCAFKCEQFYYQDIISGVERSAVSKNTYANCYALADYTKYAIDNGVYNFIYTIPMQYSLFSHVDGTLTQLAYIDGGQAHTINLDQLEFYNKDYNLSLLIDGLSVENYNNQTLKIYFFSPTEDTENATIYIYDGNTTSLLWTYSVPNSSNKNQFTYIIDMNSFAAPTTGYYRIEVLKESDAGTFTTYIKYTLEEGAGEKVIPAAVGVIISILLILFGLTLVASRYALGWVGILFCMVALGILVMTSEAWYVLFAEAAVTIVLLFIILTFKEETKAIQ